MHRTFRTTTRRRQSDLAGSWDFAPDPHDQGMTAEWYDSFPANRIPMWVPGVWNTTPGLLDYEGVGWYRCRFSLGQCTAAVLHFAAIAHQANIWVDGEPLGEHYGGFLPFSFILPESTPGEHTLVVRVDNTHDLTTTIPSSRLDWFRYGGIFRPVWVEEIAGPAYIASLRVTPVVVGSACTLRVRAEIMNLSEETISDAWTLYFDDRPARSEAISLGPYDCQVILFALDVDAQLWSPKAPHLYTVRLACADDDLIERTGFREIEIANDQVLLNGTPVRLRGVNLHQDHPNWGYAMPLDLMLRDLELLINLGANAVRGAHYPNDQRWLDLCDERGILFMEEIPLWGYTAEQLSRDIIADRASAMLWAMIERDLNHPGIWAWSVLSECATDTIEGRAIVERLVAVAHDADSTRPATYTSDKGLDDLCFDLADVVSLKAGPGSCAQGLALTEMLDRLRARIGNRPLVITAIGAEGAQGCPAAQANEPWSEERQERVLEETIGQLDGRSDLVGYYIWQLCNTRIDCEQGRAQAMLYDNCGLLDEFRRPKLAYRGVQDRWRTSR